MRDRLARLSCGLVFALAACAQVPQLFLPAPAQPPRESASARPSPQAGVHILRSRAVRVNPAAIDESTPRIALNLFEGINFEAARKRAYWTADESAWVWHGAIDGTQFGQIVIVWTNDDLVSASIFTGDGRFFRIRPTLDAHYIEQIELAPANEVNDVRRATPEELARDAEAAPPVRKTPRGPVSRDAGVANIDVLVAYTTRVRTVLGGAAPTIAKINQAVADANAANNNSGVLIQFNLAGTMEVSFDDSLGVDQALTNLMSTVDGVLDEVPVMRDTLGADVASLWIDGPGSGGGIVGIAWLMSEPSSIYANRAYNVVEQNFGPGPHLTFAHELGHNLGSEHNRANATGRGVYSYSYGLQQTAVNPTFATIMAYDNCSGGCARIPYWSNPLVQYQGIPTGISSTNNTTTSADNVTSINKTKDLVAAYRASTAGCGYSLDKSTASVSPSQGSGAISITASSNCPWYASSSALWLFITGSSSGTGNGSVGYGYTTNTTSQSRTAALTIGGQTFTITQDPTNGTVPVTIGTSPSGLQFSIDGTLYSSTQTLNWVPGATHTLSAAAIVTSPGAGPRFAFTSWSDGGAASHTYTVPSTPASVTANFTPQFLLTTSVSPANAGTIAVAPPSSDGYYNSGTQLTIQATPAANYGFTNWSGSSASTSATISLGMNAAKTLTANLTPLTVPITINTAPAGLAVSIDGASTITPAVFNWAPGTTHAIAAIRQGAAPRYRFGSWSDAGAESHVFTTPTSAASLTANMVAQYALTTAVSPAGTGTATVTPSSTDSYYDVGTTVSLSAVAASGFQFGSWTGSATGTTTPLNVTVNAAKTVTANFLVATTTVTLTSNPSGLSLTVDGTGYTTPRTFTWNVGSSHTIAAATQGTGTRYAFQNWSDGLAASHTITVPLTPSTITATFLTQHLLTLNLSDPAGGSFLTEPQSTDGYFPAGTEARITAQPGTLRQFSSWSGAVSGTINPITVTMSAPKSVLANFITLAPCTYTLTPPESSAAPSGDIRTIKVATESNCAWTAQSNANWLTILNGFGATGSGSVRFNIAPNSTGVTRTGSLTIAATSYTVVQSAAACTFTLTPPPATLPASAASYSVAIATQAGCEWSANASDDWLTFTTPDSGTGSGSVSFSIAANISNAPRMASILIAGQWLPFLQKPTQALGQFTDVPATDGFFDYINFISVRQVTNGCTSPALYCPSETMTRAEMATFVIRALYGENFPYTKTPYFTDVPQTHARFAYVQKMRDLGITTGCGGTLYCPDGPLTREQMAVFIVRARLGLTSTDTFPYPTTPFFTDVPATSAYFTYIQKLKELGITTGCSATAYCGPDPNTRGQMAVFVTRGLF